MLQLNNRLTKKNASFELHQTIDPIIIRNYKKMAVSYDSSDMAVGVFDCYQDFDELPPDGLSEK